MPTGNSSARRVAAAFAAATAAALACVLGSPGAAAGAAGDGAPGTGTCRVCHTDARYSRAFSHRGLEESAEGCLTCHGDGTAHVKARGGKGTVANPATGTPAAERELCLGCHEEGDFASPKHLEPMGKEARCTACHVVHGAEKPVRKKAGTGLREGSWIGTPPAAPERGRPWVRGVVQGGWRFVGGEEGRYEQDVNLEDGPRLMAADVQAGLDDRDPLSPTAQFRVSGLGDAHESALLRARRSDQWRVTLTARRDELPFLGQNGLHGGETLRSTAAADGDFRLSPSARLGVGYDRRVTEGEVRGTYFDNGTVIPVGVENDRVAEEACASVAVHGRAWHASLRQAWTWETGEDTRDRDLSAPGAPDRLVLDDDSRMRGPATSVLGGFEALDGRLSVEARAARSVLGREVDSEEFRSGLIGATPFTRRTTAEGSRDRVLWSGALDASFAFRPRWAVDLSLDGRSLREDGDVRVATADSILGPSAARTDERISQRVLSERVGLRHELEPGFTVRGGLERETDRLDRTGNAPPDETVATHGAFLAAEGKVTPEWTVRAEARQARGSERFTPLTPEDRQTWRLGAAYRDEADWRWSFDWQYSRLEAEDSGLGSSGNALRVAGGWGKPEEFAVDASWTIRQQTLVVDTLAFVGTSLAAGEAESKIRAHVLDLRLAVPISGRLRLVAGGNWIRDDGSLPVRALDLGLGLRWEISKTLAAVAEVRRREYDEVGLSTLDYSADILQVSVELRF